MSDERSAVSRPSFGRRLGKALVWLIRFGLRLLFVLILGVALGVAAYYGILFVYYQYVQPVQVHSIQLDQLAARQERSGLQITQRLDDLQARLEALEVQGDANKETVAGLQAQLGVVEKAQAEQTASLSALEALRTDLEAVQAALQTAQATQEAIEVELESLHDAQSPLKTDLESLQAAQDEVQAALETVQADQEAIRLALETLQTEVDTWAQTAVDSLQALDIELRGEPSPATLLQGLQLVRVMELLTRSRLLLVQNNLGLARSDIEAGRELLIGLESEVPDYQVQALADIVARLDAALENLVTAPVAAADELDGAWELLIQGLPGEPIATLTPEVTEKAAPTLEVTPGVTMTVTLTPTAALEVALTATLTPTATPKP